MNHDLNKSLVSIIIPAYNAEKTISECILSVLNQSYSNWEMIIIDDGSVDGTLEICSRFAKEDSRIIICTEKQSGVSAARNKGLDLAHGDYICFIDADDYIPSNSILKRLEAIQGTDMVFGAYVKVGSETNINANFSIIPEYYGREEALKKIIVVEELGYQGYIWNKFFRKDIIDDYGIRFAEDIAFNEDRLFCVEYILNCRKINICKDNIYFYRINPNGAMASLTTINVKDTDKYLSELVAFDRMLRLLKNNRSCYYLTVADAHMRTLQLKQSSCQCGRKYNAVLNKKLLDYAIRVLPAPRVVIPLTRKIKMMCHALIRR